MTRLIDNEGSGLVNMVLICNCTLNQVIYIKHLHCEVFYSYTRTRPHVENYYLKQKSVLKCVCVSVGGSYSVKVLFPRFAAHLISGVLEYKTLLDA